MLHYLTPAATFEFSYSHQNNNAFIAWRRGMLSADENMMTPTYQYCNFMKIYLRIIYFWFLYIRYFLAASQ